MTRTWLQSGLLGLSARNSVATGFDIYASQLGLPCLILPVTARPLAIPHQVPDLKSSTLDLNHLKFIGAQ